MELVAKVQVFVSFSPINLSDFCGIDLLLIQYLLLLICLGKIVLSPPDPKRRNSSTRSKNPPISPASLSFPKYKGHRSPA